MRTVAVVLAGGTGLRVGGELPKQLLPLGGITLLEWSVSAFDRAPGVDEVIVVMAPPFVEQAKRVLATTYPKLTHVIEGGEQRPDSTSRAIGLLSRICAGDDCKVLFHDAARPLVDQRIIADCVAALDRCQALGVVVPTADTIVRLAGDRMVSIPPREELARCQTPQGFRLSVIRDAYQRAEPDRAAGRLRATDDCGMVLRYLPDVEVHVVTGSERNLKVTYPGDLQVARSLLAEDR